MIERQWVCVTCSAELNLIWLVDESEKVDHRRIWHFGDINPTMYRLADITDLGNLGGGQ